MTRKEIKQRMLQSIQDNLEQQIEDLDMEDLIDEDILHDFLWNKDFGMQIASEYIDEHTDEIVEGFLEEIYNEIDYTDLEMPW